MRPEGVWTSLTTVPESAEEFIARKNAQWEKDRANLIRTKDVGRQGNHLWVREAWTFHVQGSYREKVLVIERLRRHGLQGVAAYRQDDIEPAEIEYRFGYYIVGRIGRAAGRWTWGQFAPLIPQADLSQLLTKARAQKTLLD